MYILKNVSIWNHVSFVNSVYYQIMTIWTCPDVSNFNFGVSKYCRKNFNQSNEIWLKNSKPCSMLNIYRYVGSIGMGWNAPGGKRAPTSPPPPPPPHLQSFFMFSFYNLEIVLLLIGGNFWGVIARHKFK